MSADWLQQRERGSRLAYEVMVWLALRLGRPLTRVLLYPICLYFMVLPRNASKGLRRSFRASPRYEQLGGLIRDFWAVKP